MLKTVSILLGIWIAGICQAANHALIIGISEYPLQPLEGPINDALAMKTVLQQQWSFDEDKITVLLNQQATRKNILKSLDKLYQKTKPEDNVLIYYSGHGTSAQDEVINAPLPNLSGALIPYDVRGIKTRSELFAKLIKGQDDLLPRLKRLDESGRHLFVAIDACYAGNSIRAKDHEFINRLPTRFLDANRLITSPDMSSIKDKQTHTLIKKKDVHYPYQNTVYLSASSEMEKAQDIPTRFLDKIPTIDNKPHGAFTNSLLEFLYEPEQADLNGDHKITYKELRDALAERMNHRGFQHTPQTLPNPNHQQYHLTQKSIFFIGQLNRQKSLNTKKSYGKLKDLGFK